MTMSREFRATVAVRVREDPTYVQALLDEAVQLFVDGEPETAKLVLRDLVNVTVGFEALAADVRRPAKSLHRMLSASGNPTMSNLSAIFAALQRSLRLDVRTEVVRV
jgi:DNA-binding phage protein